MTLKKSTILNFNCTFGEKNEEMLNYFESFVYPALTSGIKRCYKDDYYQLQQVKIVETKDKRLAVQGIIVKKATIENKTRLSVDGIEKVNETMQTYPISLFILFLDNHRMIYVENQKGSPTYLNFKNTIDHIFREYRRKINENRSKVDRVPYSLVHISPIPNKEQIKSKLDEVKKIKTFKISIFPLNADVITDETIERLYKMSESLGSNTSNINFNSPKDISKVGEAVDSSKGLANFSLSVDYKSGGRGTITEQDMSEQFPIELNDALPVEDNLAQIDNQISTKKEAKDISRSNERLYNRFKARIINLIN